MSDLQSSGKIAILADKSTSMGFKLAGVHVVRTLEVPSPQEVITDTISDITNDPEISFLLITENLVEAYGMERFEKLRRSLQDSLIIIVIPDRMGSKRDIGEGHLWKLIYRAIGRKRTD